MKEIKGDILDVQSGIICHQVNCQGVMGAGVALQIKKKYPKAEESYLAFCKKTPIKSSRLGHVTIAHVGPDLYVANIFGQQFYGNAKKTHQVYTDYVALKTAFQKLYRATKDQHFTYYFPKYFGCGLAGGNWSTIESLIEGVFGSRAVIVALPKGD